MALLPVNFQHAQTNNERCEEEAVNTKWTIFPKHLSLIDIFVAVAVIAA